MREIKFRGKRVYNGQWAYGGYHKHIKRTPCPIGDEIGEDDVQHLIIESGFSDWNLPKPINAIEVIPETVGQYTGLNDVNGKEIYEGDYGLSYGEPFWVEFNSGAFYKVWNGIKTIGTMSLLENVDGVEIVGNIHDNTELMKGLIEVKTID